MVYTAHVWREGKHWLAEFPDCPGCQTFADSRDDLTAEAQEALEGWLEAHLVDGQVPPEPKVHKRAPAGRKLTSIRIGPGLAVALQIRWARAKEGLSQGALAKKARVSQQQIAKLERPGENPTIETIAKIAKALGVYLDVELVGARS
jgi:predicted RNase H-like HicB family nuclease/DNA-binding XRE family transcriptional regulator